MQESETDKNKEKALAILKDSDVKAEESTAASGRTTESMGEVMQGALVATQKMGQIAEMLHAEVENMHEVNNTIAAVTEVTDSNSATSEETAAVSEEQKAQVETMVQMIEFFEI